MLHCVHNTCTSTCIFRIKFKIYMYRKNSNSIRKLFRIFTNITKKSIVYECECKVSKDYFAYNACTKLYTSQ